MTEAPTIATERRRLHVNGIVQGVGFRPFVYRLAQACRLSGFVNNSSDGVCIEVEGEPKQIEAFCTRLHGEAPVQARIVACDIETTTPTGERSFSIRTSRRDERPVTLIAPDIGICEACLRELFDPADRRFGYPFINCTNCGPRYTIVERIPYDRPYTSMRVFPMCPACEREYHDPADRRFHAQPNACPACGPHVTLHDNAGRRLETDDPIEAAVAGLREGKIVAVRGLGGFHLAVDARNDTAVRELRKRKGRAEKPFALMTPDVERARLFCEIGPDEEALLVQPARPIVLLKAREGHGIAPSVAPGNRYLGVMLPYTPLHALLLQDRFDALVMTSGNVAEEPITIGNEEALERLAPLADLFLLHDREILQRCDDAIARVAVGRPRMIRRSRGFVPRPVFLSRPTQQPILACGGELKNTIALSRGEAVFLSQHIGDLENPAALAFFEHSIDHLQRLLDITPEAVAYDLHPDYLSTKWALQQDGLPRIGVQHHHAHLAAVMAENGVETPTIGLILDGTGYGLDGTIWGGEVLIGDARTFDRHAWLQPLPLPGGSVSIKQPWRMALAALYAAFGEEAAALDIPFTASLRPNEAALLFRMIERRVNTPFTSSCGRLFDAVSALLGLRSEINFEAQAAIALEMALDDTVDAWYPAAVEASDGRGALPVTPLVRAIVDDLRRGEAVGTVAAKFHWSLAELFLAAARTAREHHRINRVGLSGGVYQNVAFFTYLCRRLAEEGFETLTHTEVPANDGGLALGQVVVANARLSAK